MKRFFRKLFFLLMRHSVKGIILCTLLILGAGFLIGQASFSNDAAKMLPDGSESVNIYKQSMDSNFFNRAMILFSAEERRFFDDPVFHQKFRTLASRLSAEKKYIAKVDSELFIPGGTQEQKEMFLYAMSLNPPEKLPAPEQLVRKVRRRLVMLSSMGRTGIIRLDPVNFSSSIYLPLQKFRSVTGHSAALDSPFIMTCDHKNVLLVMETHLSPSDPRSGRILESFLKKEVERSAFAPGIRYRLILPHKRAVANEEVIKKDVLLATILSVILFSLITIFLYKKDLRSFLIILLPTGGSAAGGALVALIFREPQFYVLGLGGVIVSIAVDYGIHIYSAMKTRQPYKTLYRLCPSLLIGMATSSAAFFMFVFSPMEAVRQLGFFAGSSLFFSLILMLLFLPVILHKGSDPAETPLQKLLPEPGKKKYVITIFILIWGISALLLFRLQIRTDVRQFDLSPEKLKQEEALVTKLFQNGKNSSIALFRGRTETQALEKSALFAGKKGLFTLSELIPPEKTRKSRLAQWKTFDLAAYEKQLRISSAEAGFGERFFDPFLQALKEGITLCKNGAEPSMPHFLQALRQRFALQGKSSLWYVAAMYEEASLAQHFPTLPRYATLLSREHVPRVMAQDIMKGILPGITLSLAAVLLLTTLYFRSFSNALLCMIPGMSALLVTGGIYGLTGKEINIPVMAGGVILCGLAVDYGIFIQHAIQNNARKLIYHSVTLSALTTFAGGLTVAFTSHPMLRDGGITLICGITVTWATALFFLPACLEKRSSK